MSATINSQLGTHLVQVETNGAVKRVHIPCKSSGYGSSISGGELLLLALATCYCNDLYREAAKQNIVLMSVEVVCYGEFDAEGEPGSNFTYKVHVVAEASQEAIDSLIKDTDEVAEVHNTLRKGIDIRLVK